MMIEPKRMIAMATLLALNVAQVPTVIRASSGSTLTATLHAQTGPATVVGLTGAWFGSYRNDKGESGTSIINLVERANGVLTGDEAGWKIQHGHRFGNVLTWQYLKRVRGCRDYQVRLELSDDGKVLTGTYTVKDRCAGPANYSGQYVKYERK